MRELLRVETLCAGYGRRQVLKDVSFAVGRFFFKIRYFNSILFFNVLKLI